MKQRQMSFRFWFRASVVVATMLLSGSLAAQSTPPKISKVFPPAGYADEDHFQYPLYAVTVFGEKLPDKANLRIYLSDREARLSWDPPPTKTPTRPPEAKGGTQTVDKGAEIYAQRDEGSSQLRLWINKNHYSGTFELRVGSANPNGETLRSDERLSVTLAKIGHGADRRLFLGVTIVVALVVLFLPVFLVWKLVRRQKIAGTNTKQSLLDAVIAALFLDKETATYSLSKFQFYLWTVVSVIGYLYLEASTCIVQGVWRFIDIPDNLPAIVFISATTGALAQFATAQRGPKGAGEQHPTLADFVSSGGVISPDRVQFFIWTIIGVVVFLGLALQQDPASISSLPTVPDGFLQLMGISSLGYLSGKFARRPGPVINDIALKVEERAVKKKQDAEDGAKAKTENLPTKKLFSIITLRGRILSPDADFKITKSDKQVSLTGDLAPHDMIVLEPDEQSSKLDKTAKKLELIINQPDLKWLRGASTFTISNPDGQSAGWSLPTGPQIESITASVTLTELQLILRGTNLAQAATFRIDGTEITKAQPPPIQIKAEPDTTSPTGVSTTKLDLKISNADAKWITPGQHILTMANPDDQPAEKEFTIEKKPAAPTQPVQPTQGAAVTPGNVAVKPPPAT